jgi:hypothetical protein
MPAHPRYAAALLVLALPLAAGCGGHYVRGELAPNHPGVQRFNFLDPGCDKAQRPATTGNDDVVMRYLGAGGLYLEWQGTSILTGPFFSNPKIPFRRLAANTDRIDEGLRGIDLSKVRAILVGHSHYDHLADVPEIAGRLTPGAWIYVNQTGANVLAGTSVKGRVVSLEDPDMQTWIWARDEDGRALPIRFRAFETEHAPLYWHVHWSRGEVTKPWTEWNGHRFYQLKAGRPLAFVIDFLAQDLETVRFRLYYQDSASPEGKGYPQLDGDDQAEFDLAVLCMASSQFVRNHPGGILGAVQPHHVLVTHYENFFRDAQKPVRFVALLTNHAADRFLTAVSAALPDGATGPVDTVCGPSSRVATMPLPGEWLRFRASRGEP